jgi:hypothetical protein
MMLRNPSDQYAVAVMSLISRQTSIKVTDSPFHEQSRHGKVSGPLFVSSSRPLFLMFRERKTIGWSAGAQGEE